MGNRADDAPHEYRDRINDLIQAEQNPKDRAFLVILQSINQSVRDQNNALISHSNTLQNLESSFSEHLRKFNERAERDDQILNQGRGIWKVLAWVLGLLQMITIGLLIWSYQEYRDMHESLIKHELRLDILEKHGTKLELHDNTR